MVIADFLSTVNSALSITSFIDFFPRLLINISTFLNFCAVYSRETSKNNSHMLEISAPIIQTSQNDDLSRTESFRIKNTDFKVKNDNFLVKNDDFRIRDDQFDRKDPHNLSKINLLEAQDKLSQNTYSQSLPK